MRRATRAFFQRALLSYPNFNPRSPWGERPVVYKLSDSCCSISIHALREESDPSRNSTGALHFNFNPRSPWGERHKMFIWMTVNPLSFQSTLSVRRATSCCQLIARQAEISIHALREESDPQYRAQNLYLLYFNPRSPWGERQWTRAFLKINPRISIHALREESDSH